MLSLECVEIAKTLRGIRRPDVEPDHRGEERRLTAADVVRPVAVRDVPDRLHQIGEVVEHASHEVGPTALAESEHGEI